MVGDAVPELLALGLLIRQTLVTRLDIAAIPVVESTAGYLHFGQGLFDGQFRCLYQADDFQLLSLRIVRHASHSFSKPVRLFFSTRFFSANSATNCLSWAFSSRRSSTSSLLACRLVSPAKRDLPASRNSLLH